MKGGKLDIQKFNCGGATNLFTGWIRKEGRFRLGSKEEKGKK